MMFLYQRKMLFGKYVKRNTRYSSEDVWTTDVLGIIKVMIRNKYENKNILNINVGLHVKERRKLTISPAALARIAEAKMSFKAEYHKPIENGVIT